MLKKSFGNFPAFSFTNNGENNGTAASSNPQSQTGRSVNSRGSARVGSSQSRRNSSQHSARLAARSSDEASGRTPVSSVPVLRNSVILQQAKIKNYSDFILFFIHDQGKLLHSHEAIVEQESHTKDEPLSIQRIEEIILDSSSLFEATFQDQSGIQVMDEFVSLLKAIHMSYSEWFDFIIIRCKQRDALNQEEFTREVIRLCQDLRRPPMEAPNIQVLFKYVYGNPSKKPPNEGEEQIKEINSSIETLEKEQFDVAFERYQFSTSQLRKLTVAASQLRSLGVYMKQNDVKVIEIAKAVDDLQIIDNHSIPTSQLDPLLSNLVANYDAYVYEHGTPVDLIESIAANFGNGAATDGMIGGGNLTNGRRRSSRSMTGNMNMNTNSQSMASPSIDENQPSAYPNNDPHELHNHTLASHIPPLKRVLSDDMDESPAELRLLMKNKAQHQNSFKLGNMEMPVPSSVSNVMNSIGNIANSLTKQFTFNHNTAVVPMQHDELDEHQHHHQQLHQQQQPIPSNSRKKKHRSDHDDDDDDDSIDLRADNEYIKHLNIEEQMQLMKLVDPHHAHHNYDEVESHFHNNNIRSSNRRNSNVQANAQQIAGLAGMNAENGGNTDLQSVAARYSVAHPHNNVPHNNNIHHNADNTNGNTLFVEGSTSHAGLQRENSEQRELRFYNNFYNDSAAAGGGTAGGAGGVGAGPTANTAANTANPVEIPVSSSARRSSVMDLKPANAANNNNSQFRGLLDSFNTRLESANTAKARNR